MLQQVLSIVFRVLSGIVSVYTLLCFIRIILTWIPNAEYSSFTRFLAKVCDPYLNIFNRIHWLTIGSFNFSPALALCLLSALSALLINFSNQGTITVGMLLSLLLTLIWSIFSSIIIFFIIILAVRLILLLANKDGYVGSLLDQVDRSITPFVYRIACTFSFKKNMPYKNALIIALIVLVIFMIVASILVNHLGFILNNLHI